MVFIAPEFAEAVSLSNTHQLFLHNYSYESECGLEQNWNAADWTFESFRN